jgi:galactose mutarotase-like enzyme
MITLKNEFISAKIDPLGAELKSLVYNGKEYIWDARPEVWGKSSPIMFPICGGLKDDKYTLNGKEYTLAKHGYAQNTLFEVEKATDTNVVFLHVSDENTKVGFPFDYEFRVIFTLDGLSLHVRYSVKNVGESTMYFNVGAHEGYYTPEGIEDYDVIFPEPVSISASGLCGNLITDSLMPIITNTTHLPLYDKYFTIDALVFKNIPFHCATLRNRKTGRAVTVEFPDAPYFLLWHKPASPYICLEPWGGIPDTVGSSYDITEKEGITVLEAGNTYNYDHTITVTQ